ncbi:MAG: linear amide C-N hydrolase [Candidatus Obscuribacterales bacterium]|nr:linear amide C-N hydrolase [Candidatus Obscuribacterales bacterium]
MKNLVSALLSVSISLGSFVSAEACSRFTYTGLNNTVVTGRSMDWVESLRTDLWVFPAGIKHTAVANDPNSAIWTSKYGSVIASGYDLGTTDGINSEGLTANMLYLSTTDYGPAKPDRKNISIFNWTQYVLDNYAAVDEVVKDYGQDKFNMIAPTLPNGSYPTVHLAVTDKNGDNAVFEYVGGKLVVHHGKEFKVMTNEPAYDKQLALNDYWQNLKGKFLPGTEEPEDRFVRASYYLNTAPQTSDEKQSVATTFSIIRNVSVPFRAGFSERPNVSTTIWRSVADLKNKVYYFENTDRPNIVWVDLNKLDLKVGAPVKKLPLQHGELYSGDVSDKFVASKSFFDK